MPVSQINALASSARERQATVAAAGAPHRLIYGRARLGGRIFAFGKIGTDWVFGYEWCLGEIEQIESLWLNDAALPGGVLHTNYLGTLTQTPDPWLVSAIAGYNDPLIDTTITGAHVGIAYTVLRIPASVEGFPRLQAVIKGKKVYDPRTGLVAYTENPALHAGDLVSSTAYGMGRAVSDLDVAADNCDVLLQGTDPRCRMGLVLSDPRRTKDYVDLIAEYAEMFWVEDGGSIRFIPDAPVAEPAGIIGVGDYVRGSLRIESRDLGDAPSVVETSYVDTAGGGEPWKEVTASASLPGVSEGLVPRVPTTARMDGIGRFSEAFRKSLRRLRRAAVPNVARWDTFDLGIRAQIGVVFRLLVPERGVDLWVRVTGVSMTQPGRYSVEGSQYSPDLYPDDVISPGGTTPVPIGAMALLRSGDVPGGWELVPEAVDRMLIGAGDGRDAGTTGGSTAIALSGNTSLAGAHSVGGGGDPIRAPAGGGDPGTGSVGVMFGSEPDHQHAYTGAGTHTPRQARYRLIKKVSGVETLLPANCLALGLGNIYNPAIFQVVERDGCFVAGGAAAAEAGTATATCAVTTTTNGMHDHNLTNVQAANDVVFPEGYGALASSGGHAHNFTLTLPYTPPHVKCGLFGGQYDFPATVGMIFPHVGDLGDLPTDWQLCDGTNGTPDMTGKFLKIDSTGMGVEVAGAHSMTYSSNTNSVSHSHFSGITAYGYVPVSGGGHGYSSHLHTVSGALSFMPPYMAVNFIAYVPGV